MATLLQFAVQISKKCGISKRKAYRKNASDFAGPVAAPRAKAICHELNYLLRLGAA